MPIIVTLDIMLAKRKMKGRELCARIGISETQLSLLRSGKVRGVRFSTFARMCAALDCKPGDLLDYRIDASDLEPTAGDQGDA
jgi:putative transcriptional regulator